MAVADDIAEVIDIIALELGATAAQLRSGGKAAALTANRRVAIHVARLVTGTDIAALAAWFGCEGETVVRACRQTDAERAAEPKLQDTLNWLISLCGGRAAAVAPLGASEPSRALVSTLPKTPSLARAREATPKNTVPRGVPTASNAGGSHVTAPAKLGKPPLAAIQQTTGRDPGTIAAPAAGLLTIDRLGEGTGWTDARVERLTQLWADGKSAAEIAIELGGGVTRNAVVGKAHRLGLAERASPIIRRDIPNSSIGDLPARLCHWPIGDPKHADFHFCALPVDPKAPRAAPGPYCDEHVRAAYQPRARRDEIDSTRWAGRQTKIFA